MARGSVILLRADEGKVDKNTKGHLNWTEATGVWGKDECRMSKKAPESVDQSVGERRRASESECW